MASRNAWRRRRAAALTPAIVFALLGGLLVGADLAIADERTEAGPVQMAQAEAPQPPTSTQLLQPEANRWRLMEPLGSGITGRSPLYDPYSPNVLKGDYPIFGDKYFGAITAVLDAVADFKRNLDYFTTDRIRNVPYHEHNLLGQFTATAAFEISHGDTVFQPQDWRVRLTPIIRWRCGDQNAIDQGCGEDIRMLEAFGDVKLFEVGNNFDATTARLGLQIFNADFFGLIYNDVQPGARVFSELGRNQFKANIAYFDRLNKEKLSALNEWKRREDAVVVANVEWDDFLVPGFNVLPAFVANFDDKLAKHLEAYYVGATATGRLGRVNVNGAGYYVFGGTADNTPTKQREQISAWMGLAQVLYPISYFTPRLALLYASPDEDPRDRKAHGFDSAFDNVNFGGGQFSYLFGEKIQLGATTVFRGNSVFPSLRGANATSQFVNPGLLAVNAGADAALTAKLVASVDVNYAQFNNTSSVQLLVKRPHVAQYIGTEVNGGITYKPFLNEQVILFVGGGVLVPGQGIHDMFGGDAPVYKLLVRTVLTF